MVCCDVLKHNHDERGSGELESFKKICRQVILRMVFTESFQTITDRKRELEFLLTWFRDFESLPY